MLYWLDGRSRRPRSRAHQRGRRARPGSGVPVAGLLLAAAVAALGLWWLSGHHRVTLVAEGEISTHETHAATVAEFLDRAGVVLGHDERVVPAAGTPLRAGMRIEVVDARAVSVRPAATPRRLQRPARGSRPAAVALAGVAPRAPALEATEPAEEPTPEQVTSHEVREAAVEFGTVERATDALPRGERREVRAGRPGLVEITEEVVRVGGEERSRTVVGERVVTEPVDRVVEVGTAEPAPAQAGDAQPPAEPEPPPTEHQQPPAEPAAAEAGTGGGEPGATPAPDPSEGDQPDPRNVETGDASWYDNPYGGFTGAHRTIPRGTIVRVTNLANGRSIDVRINDRGPFVDGRIIDLNRAAFAELAPPSSGVIQVRIEW